MILIGHFVNQKQYNELKNSNGPFSVKIDTDLTKRITCLRRIFNKRQSKKEILISTYICHPSMANDCLVNDINSFLGKMSNFKLKWSYRLFCRRNDRDDSLL